MFRILFSLFTLFIPASAFAQGTYNLIAPIGSLTGAVSLKDYLEGAFQTIIGIAGILAVLMLVICGIKLMGTGSVAAKSEAKQCIWNAIFGLLLAIGSWILLNTINPLLLRNDAELAAQAPTSGTAPAASATTEPNPTTPGCYFKYQDKAGNTKFAKFDGCDGCTSVRKNFVSDPANYTVLSECYQVKSGAGATTPPASTAPPTSSVPGSISCSGNPGNLCEGQFRQCTNSTCARFNSIASTTANGAASVNLLKAIIIQESSCGQNLYGPATKYGQACGPTQLLVSTANTYRSSCGVTEPVTCGWLANEANWSKAVCITAKYLNVIAGSTCGSDVRNIAAGYNAGPGRCSPSTSCGGDTSCSGYSVRQWECLYDDTKHQVCNGGFIETRNYATKVLYCTNNPAY
jgi:hypothetical protein